MDVPKLITAYFAERPEPSVPGQRVAFGTSGHRGSSLTCSFNEAHILAITQAVAEYRRLHAIDGPLFLGTDTHALSEPAFATALEVLAANGVEVMIAAGREYTPTPAISHAILAHNRSGDAHRADGIVVTPSHNPPDEGGFKYNPPSGGPANTDVTTWIEQRANALLEGRLSGVRRVPYAKALRSASTHQHDFLTAYVEDLASVVDLDAVRSADLHLGVDPLGGAGVHYWPRIADRYGLALSVTNDLVDPTFRFMFLDWDGRIRMDPSSPYVMQGLVGLKDSFDIGFACDTDHDRHGIVTKSVGLLPPNHYLAVCIQYLLTHRARWAHGLHIGKTIVSSAMIDRIVHALGARLDEVPVGFKWFVDGLLDGSIGFAGEESAGATLLRRDGRAWTTDKDGIALALLAAEITACAGHDPGDLYRDVSRDYGACVFERTDVPATAQDKRVLGSLTREQLHATSLAGEPIREVLTVAPGNHHAIGGVKVVAEHGWFAVRPSGTEEVYKLYAESFRDTEHLRTIQDEARDLIGYALAHAPVAGP